MQASRNLTGKESQLYVKIGERIFEELKQYVIDINEENPDSLTSLLEGPLEDAVGDFGSYVHNTYVLARRDAVGNLLE